VIVFEDADLKDATRRGLSGAISANGQGCVIGTRLLVQRSIYEPYLETLTAAARAVRIGDPFDRATVLGPVISEASLQRILGMVHRATADGGRLVTGGERLGGGFSEGFFMPVTIIADVDNLSYIAQHEVFGPVLSVIPFDTEEEAIALANGTDYGLGAYVHTQNLRRAHYVASQLDAGQIQVNASGEAMAACVPFGGVKQSGYGRLGGEAGVHEFLRIKNVFVNLTKVDGGR
jgi:acyl-CoA reductase-like NAD-dependent aldehyde dehydrogenase